MFERLDLTVSIEMDHEGKIINCSKNIYDVFGHKRKCVSLSEFSLALEFLLHPHTSV